ncbi:MAG TPA: hypothetical protein VGH56_09600 [Solirubrobacteraceae bacterium]
MGFETFKRQRVAPSKDATLTIQRRGAMSLNRAAFEALDEAEVVELLWDRDERLIGLRKAEPGTPHAYTVRPAGRDPTSTWVFSGSAFTRYYGIATEVPRRYTCRLEDAMLIADLKEPGIVVGNRARPRESAQEALDTPDSSPEPASWEGGEGA